MKVMLLRVLVLWVAAISVSVAQTTHLSQPVHDVIRIVFGQKSGDPKGTYRAMLAQYGDGNIIPDWQVPSGMALVITDITLPGTNEGNAKPIEGLFWIFAWELANPASQYQNLRLPLTVRVEADTSLSVLNHSFTAGLVFTHDWQPGVRDLLNSPNQSDLTLAFVRPTALGYLVAEK